MTTRATGTFTVLSWEENTYEDLDGGAKLTKARVSFGFSGDLEAEGGWEAVMCYRDDGTAVFTGLQRTVGKLAGRDGSFVLQADGTFGGGEARTSWQIIPGSATGDLRGLTGAGSTVTASESGGTFTLDYDLD
jgi:Protein of unknown function (DUF3224)